MSVNNENSPNTPEAGAANTTPASQKRKSRQVPKDFKPLKQVEIDTLKSENAELKSIIDKLKTATSFEDFKSQL